MIFISNNSTRLLYVTILFSNLSSQMELTEESLESWLRENTDETPDADHLSSTSDLYDAFKTTHPSGHSKDTFLCMLGKVVKKLGHQKVTIYRKGNRCVAYRGLVLKGRAHSLNTVNIKTWAHSTFTPGSAQDTVKKEAAWLSYLKYSDIESSINHREQFFSVFGQHVAGKDEFKAVTSNRKRKCFIGLKFNDSSIEENSPPPKRACSVGTEEEKKEVNETNIMAPEKRIDGDSGSTPENVNPGSPGTSSMESKYVSHGRSVDANETRCGSVGEIGNDRIMEPTESIVEESMPEESQGKASSDEEFSTISDDVDSETFFREADTLSDHSVDADQTSRDSTDEIESKLSSQAVTNVNIADEDENSDDDDSVKNTFFHRHRKNVKNLMPSQLPGKPKSFKTYLDEIFLANETLNPERLKIQKRGAAVKTLSPVTINVKKT